MKSQTCQIRIGEAISVPASSATRKYIRKGSVSVV